MTPRNSAWLRRSLSPARSIAATDLLIRHGQQQVDLVPAAVELDARSPLVGSRRAGEHLEGRLDSVVDLRRLAPQTRAQVAAARKRAGLEAERGGVVHLLRLDADAVLPGRGVEGPVELSSARAYQALELLPGRLHLVDVVVDAEADHMDFLAFDRRPCELFHYSAPATAISHSCRYSTRSGSSRSARSRPARYSSSEIRSKVAMWRPRIRSSATSRVTTARWLSLVNRGASKPAGGSSAPKSLRVGKRARSISSIEGK